MDTAAARTGSRLCTVQRRCIECDDSMMIHRDTTHTASHLAPHIVHTTDDRVRDTLIDTTTPHHGLSISSQRCVHHIAARRTLRAQRPSSLRGPPSVRPHHMSALQRSQRAIINQCFTKKVADKDRTCLHCSATYKHSTSPSSLQYHLWVHHRDLCETLGILATPAQRKRQPAASSSDVVELDAEPHSPPASDPPIVNQPPSSSSSSSSSSRILSHPFPAAASTLPHHSFSPSTTNAVCPPTLLTSPQRPRDSRTSILARSYHG
jgi:hypothetical protein